MNRDEIWNRNFEQLQTYVREHHHLPDKKKVENRGLLNWAKYQRKKIKEGALEEEKVKAFVALMATRTTEHTGGRRSQREKAEGLTDANGIN
ncbi:MAG: helicase associated domain-containing protein [Bacteroidaceae bacterium]|nr:helicase associated domain-containing protein [Bacteroidaceae bacterium]